MYKQLAKAICIIKGDYQSPDMVPTFELLDTDPNQLAVYMITQGLYKGTQYRVGRVGFAPEGDGFRLSFTTDVIKHPWWGKIKDSDEDFTQIAGNILCSVMQSSGDPGQFLVM